MRKFPFRHKRSLGLLRRKEIFTNVAPLTWRFLHVSGLFRRHNGVTIKGGDKMGFSKMMELLQEKNRGKIVLCNAGNFYIAIGKDALALHEIIGLKLSCFK